MKEKIMSLINRKADSDARNPLYDTLLMLGILLAVSLIISAMTTRLKKQEKQRYKAQVEHIPNPRCRNRAQWLRRLSLHSGSNRQTCSP